MSRGSAPRSAPAPHENRRITEWVRGSLDERVASYRIALEHMVIAAPSPVAVEAERQLNLLQQRIVGYSV